MILFLFYFVIMCGRTKCACVLVCITSFENWKNIISKVPKEGDVKDVAFQALKATM
jgi:hypothetical protein